MAITLRTTKGTALTYQELDVNFTSFFYSASLSADQKQLSLFYTGSSNLPAAGTVNIPLNPYTGSLPPVGGDNLSIQYRNGASFGGAAELLYDNAAGGLGIGTGTLESNENLRIQGGDLALSGSELRIQGGDYSGSIAYGGVSRDFVFRNWDETNNADIQFWNGGAKRFTIHHDGTLTQNDGDPALGDVVLSGSIIFGANHSDAYRSKLQTWDSNNPRIENNSTHDLQRGELRGVILEGPQSAQVVIGLQSNGNEGFNIISAPPTSSQEPTYNRLVAHFGADGNVGIGTSTNPTGYQFTVSGSISGSAGMYIAGNSVISGSVTTRSNLFVDQATTLSGSVTLNTIPSATAADNYNFLVQQSNQVVKQVNAAPIPVGGIIMWSGTIATIPSGWALCNGSNGTPDLRNKFIVGAHSDLSGAAKSNVENASTFRQTGGDINHDHGGSTSAETLSVNQIPAHSHTYKDSYYIEINNPGVGASGAIGGVDYVGPTKYKGSGDSDNDNKYVYYRNGTTNLNTTTAASHDHSITANNHLPPYYALAYIMYTG